MIKINEEVICQENFPDGTLRIKHEPSGKAQRIYWKFESNEELVSLIFLTRSLQDKGYEQIELIMPYIPNARQDRVKKLEDVFTLKYFCEIINTLEFEKVYVLDPHSDVACALLDRVEKMPVLPYIEQAIKLSHISAKNDLIFYPDNGSQKRYSELITFPNAFGIKKRNWETGKIEALDVAGSIPQKIFDVLIVDDISSFGGTFYHSALKLKSLGARKIYLYITHCENSILQGKLFEEDLIEHIYTTDSLLTKQHAKITVLPINY